MFRKLREKLREKVSRPVRGIGDFPDILTIETSYACNLRCVMCPRSFDPGDQGILAPEVFDKIEPEIGLFKFVSLCGFGEPMMNKRMPEMIERISRHGCGICVTTNGILLDRSNSEALIKAGLTALNVSVDACTKETYEKIRGKGLFDILMKNLKGFFEALGKSGRSVHTQWVFLMMDSNVDELPEAVRIAAGFGFDTFVAKQMETAASKEELCHALFDTKILPPPSKEAFDNLADRTHEAGRIAEESGIKFVLHPQVYKVGNVCLAEPLNSVFVDHKGNVSACCYLNTENVRKYMDKLPSETGVLGNVTEGTIAELLQSPQYTEFRNLWQKGKIPPVCRGCLQVYRMD